MTEVFSFLHLYWKLAQVKLPNLYDLRRIALVALSNGPMKCNFINKAFPLVFGDYIDGSRFQEILRRNTHETIIHMRLLLWYVLFDCIRGTLKHKWVCHLDHLKGIISICSISCISIFSICCWTCRGCPQLFLYLQGWNKNSTTINWYDFLNMRLPYFVSGVLSINFLCNLRLWRCLSYASQTWDSWGIFPILL